MEAICADVRRLWPDAGNIAIHHRLGKVPVKEASVVIAVSAPHRQTAIDAVEYAITELKGRVPIWKKEFYAEHSAEWKANRECRWILNGSSASTEITSAELLTTQLDTD